MLDIKDYLYSCYILLCLVSVSPEQTSAVFEGLCRVVKHVANPGDCSSAERCILAHLYDLYSSCVLLKAKHCEPFSNAYPKIRQALYAPLAPAPSTHPYNPQFMIDVISNPRRLGQTQNGSSGVTGNSATLIVPPAVRLEPHWARQLAENPANR
jgi:mediator of RNA polymerase II transcription subunit 12